MTKENVLKKKLQRKKIVGGGGRMAFTVLPPPPGDCILQSQVIIYQNLIYSSNKFYRACEFAFWFLKAYLWNAI
jgi:hypothetical protein